MGFNGALSNRDFQIEMSHAPDLIVPRPADEAFQPNSIDLRLHRRFFTVEDQIWHSHTPEDPFILKPLQFVLGSTLEEVNVPAYLRMKIEGKSSLGRIGLSVHQTAGHLDSGFKGRVTLEFFNCTQLPVVLVPGTYICQVIADYNSRPAWPLYGDKEAYKSHYQGQRDTKPSYLTLGE
jgi:dCTP deaminase